MLSDRLVTNTITCYWLIFVIAFTPMASILPITLETVYAEPQEVSVESEGPNDNTPPSVVIISPQEKATVPPGQILVQGNTSDNNGSGVEKVEAFIHTLPFDNNYPFKLATPKAPGDWSFWSMSLKAQDTGTHRVLVKATDKTGNENWDEVIVNVSTEPSVVDLTPPTVKITSPMYCISVTKTGTFLFTGVANDTESGIEKVEAFVEKPPFGRSFPFKLATPKAPDDWSSWTLELEMGQDNQAYRVLVRATDNAGNENWDEGIYNVSTPPPSLLTQTETAAKRAALIDNSFTNGAYNIDGFYTFYPRFANVEQGVDISEELFRLTAVIPANYELGSDYREIVNHIKKSLPLGSSFSVMDDVSVHKGWIFDKNGNNLYDLLVLTHNEYVTAQEYNNLKRFVENGGTIVFLDGNIFYAQVQFNEASCTVTLVKGHDWEFDGQSARKSVSERYFSDNTKWVGSNYMINSLTDDITFENNPFDYNHFEENYVSNPKARILIDYGINVPDDYTGDPGHRYAKVATYEMNYGKGKVIMLGIYSTNLKESQEFLDALENVILFHAVSPVYRFTDVADDDKEFPIYWKMDSGSLKEITVDNDTKSITLKLDRGRSNNEDTLRISLPKQVIDISSANSNISNSTPELVVMIDGKKAAAVHQTELDYERILSIELPDGAGSEVKIVGTQVIPEFPIIHITLVLAMLFGFVLLASNRVHNHPLY